MSDDHATVIFRLDLLKDLPEAGFIRVVVIHDQQARLGAVCDFGELMGRGVILGAVGRPIRHVRHVIRRQLYLMDQHVAGLAVCDDFTAGAGIA